MTANQADFPIEVMARVLGVSRSGFYAWISRAPSARARADATLTNRIQAIHKRSRETYGAPRIHAELADEGTSVSRKRVERLMKAAGLKGVSRRRFVRTTIKDKRSRPAADLVDRNFYADEPNLLWGERLRAIGSSAARTTSLTCRPGPASSISLWFWTPSLGGSSAGRWAMISRPGSSSTPSTWRSHSASPKMSSFTLIKARSTRRSPLA